MRPCAFVILAGVLLATACSPAEQKRPDLLVTPTAAVTPPAPSAAPPPAPAPAPPPPAPAPRPPRGKLLSFSFAPSSGKVDKVGTRDGALGPDGVKDLVFEAELEGAAIALMVVSTDASGKPNGKLTADTFVGTQLPPSEDSAEIKPGLMTAGIGVFENDRLLNAKDGSLEPLGEGRHRLTLHVSLPNTPKGTFKAFAVFDDRSLVASGVATP